MSFKELKEQLIYSKGDYINNKRRFKEMGITLEEYLGRVALEEYEAFYLMSLGALERLIKEVVIG
jgi:hypothetical protein